MSEADAWLEAEPGVCPICGRDNCDELEHLPPGAPDDDADSAGGHDLTHDGLALELGERWRNDARHVAAWSRWLFFKGSHWETDETLLHMTRCRDFLRERAEALQAAGEENVVSVSDEGEQAKIRSRAKRQADTLRNAYTVAQVVGLARSNEAQSTGVALWDADPFLLGTPGGTVDLRSGELRHARPDDYITKAAAVAPAQVGTTAPLWMQYLETITQQNVELVSYLQRWIGYALTGSICEHAFAFGHGTGANGKGVFTRTLQGILGDYAITIPTEMLMVNTNERHPTELARLRGVRLALGSETESGTRWAEARIKSLTGGDPIAARFMRQDYFEFAPTFKLFVVGNHRPSLRGVDEAIRRRFHLVPFTVTIPVNERDGKLPEKLQPEWPAILRWALDGCLAWQREGLNPPKIVTAATEDYLAAEDAFRSWVDDCTMPDPNAWESSAALYTSWKRWAEIAGEHVGSQKRFAQTLMDHGYKPSRSGAKQRTKGYVGLQLTEHNQGAADASDASSYIGRICDALRL